MVDPANPKLEPSSVESKTFSTIFRGFDPTEVREHLKWVADQVRAEQRSNTVAMIPKVDDSELESLRADLAELDSENDELKNALDHAESQLASRSDQLAVASAEPTELDEDRLTELLGEETTRVLQSARAAAAEIRAKAQAKADAQEAELEAEETSQRERLAAAAATQKTELAEAKAAAEAEAAETVANAKAEAAALVAEAQTKASDLHAATEHELAALRTATADEVSASRLAGEEVAAALKARAEEVADETRRVSEEEATMVRSSAEAVKSDADAEAARIRAEAEADSSTSRDAAREEARLMLTEAQALREKVLADLVEKRRQGRTQLDQTKAARDRLARSLGSARKDLDEVIEELKISVPEAKRALEGLGAPQPAASPQRDAVALAAELDSARSDGIAIPGVTREGSEDSGSVSEDDLFDRIRATRPDEATGADSGVAPEESGKAEVVESAVPSAEPQNDRSAEVEEAAETPEAAPVVSEHRAAYEASPRDEENSADVDADDLENEIEVPEPFHARDIAFTRFGPDLRRQFKRALADDQSDVLDRLRRSRKNVSVDELPDERAMVLRYLDAIGPALTAMADAGASEGAGGSAPSDLVDELVDRTARALVTPMRARIETTVTGADDPDEVLEPVRAHYREYRTSVLPELADDALAEAFAMGLYESLAKGTRLQWLADPRDNTSADCHDNTFESVKKPKKFPTGHVRPLATPGCRCLVVAAE